MSKPKTSIDPASLVAFGNVAAGHEGVLSDPSGQLVIKPCTKPEISFYETAIARHPDFAAYMPTFMGTLNQSSTPSPDADQPTDNSVAADTGTAATLGVNDVGPMHGKALDTDLLIVMENVTAGFTKPNILDVKLGARLWDDDAPAAKRARLDDVAAKSTSGSLGFRIAGMKLWKAKPAVPMEADDVLAMDDEDVEEEKEKSAGNVKLWEYDEETSYTSYNKLYGRKFNAGNVVDGFKEYLGLNAGQELDEDKKLRAEEVVHYFAGKVKRIQAVLEKEESRMYSASILFVYEGDLGAYAKTKNAFLKSADEVAKADGEEDDDEAQPKLAAVKMIDFAHATWTPGQGPDENALRGVRSTAVILENIEKELGS